MATQLKVLCKSEEEDDEEALRLAALKTLKKKNVPATFCPPPRPNIIKHKHRRNPHSNLITIVPDSDSVFKPPQTVAKNPSVRFNSNVLVLNNVKSVENLEPVEETKVESKKEGEEEGEEEEVSTKFSRFEDTKSESEDESDTDNKGSNSSDESDADYINLKDDDDSLEALMAQMEQEFEEGSETKLEKKKNKSSNKTKSKLNITDNNEEKDKIKQKIEVDKTEIVDVKNTKDTSKVKFQRKSVSPIKVEVKPISRSSVNLSPEINLPLLSNKVSRVSPFSQKSPVKKINSPDRPKSPVRHRSPIRLKSPVKSQIRSPLRSPIRSKSPLHSSILKSPVRQKNLRSPPRHKSPLRSPLRHKSPLRFSPGRRSRSPLRPYSPIGKYPTIRKSPARRSPSPYSRTHRSRSPLRKRSPSPFLRKDRGFIRRSKDRSPKYSPPSFYNRSPSPGRDRRSLTPPTKKWRPLSPRRSPSPVRYRSPNQIRRSISPRRYSRSPSPAYYSPRRVSPPVFKKKIVSSRRSLSPSPGIRRSLTPRRRSISPRRRELSPVRRDLSPKVEITSKRFIVGSPRRRPVSPNKFKRFSPPPRSPLRRQRSSSPQRRSPQPRRRMNSPQRQKHDRTWNKNERPKSDNEVKLRNWSRSPSLSLASLSPSPQPRDSAQSDETSRRHKSPLRVQKSGGDNFYNKSEKRPVSPDNRNGGGDGDRRRTGRNWDKRGKSWNGRRQDRDRRREDGHSSRYKKELQKNEKPMNDKSNAPILLQKTDDPILEARRKKFQSNDLVEPASKKIRLRNSPVKEKQVEIEVRTKPEEPTFQPENEDVLSKSGFDDLDLDVEDDILDLGAELWSSDEGEPIVRKSGNVSRKVVRPPSPKKNQPVKEKIVLENKVDNSKSKASTCTSTEFRAVSMEDKALSPLTVIQKDDKEKKSDKNISPFHIEAKDEIDSDLRAELSRRRAERLTKAGSVHKNLPTRIVQSAFESVMGKKKVKKSEKKEKESKTKSKEKMKKALSPSPPPFQDVPREKTDGRRVLVLKRTAPVRLPSQTAINVTFNEGDEDSSDSDSDEKYVSPLKRKLPIHMRLGIPEERRRLHKVRKVKLKHRNQV